MKKLLRQMLKFLVVGGSAFFIDYGIMILLTEKFQVHYLFSSGISFSVSVIYNYIFSILWVFDVGKKRKKGKEFIAFIILSVIGLGLNQILMWILVDFIELFYMLAKIIATGIVMVYNFVTRKRFLEGKEERI